MCGIFCHIGKKSKSKDITLEGLAKLEHRGYDSLGISFLENNKLVEYKISQVEKKDCSAKDLRSLSASNKGRINVAIAHNRWATVGEVSINNAHPHHDKDRLFYLVQNGNLENLSEVESKIGTWQRYSQTDTEAIVNLLAKFYKENKDFLEAVKKTINFIDGANALVVLKVDEPEKLLVANKGGALRLAKNDDGVMIVSDKSALDSFEISKERKLEANEIAIVDASSWSIFDSNKNNKEKDEIIIEKRDFDHYMLKEIYEQGISLQNTLSGRVEMDKGITHFDCAIDLARELRRAKTFHFVACGTAYNACQYASLVLNRFGISSRSWIASEFSSNHLVYEASDVFVFLSQSGETADTIEVLNEIKIKGNTRLGIVNVPGSRIWEETHAGIGIRAGREIGVASTKAYTSMLMSVLILAIFLARQRKMSIDSAKHILRELESIPSKVQEILKQENNIKVLAKKYSKYKNYYFLGRYFNSVTAAEASLKLKEISYIHAEDYPLGEMKHGPLALVDEDFCSVVIAPDDNVFNKSYVNTQEIKARKGRVIAVCNESAKLDIADDLIYIPATHDYLSPILSIIPLQLFSYYMALELGKNPDKPRNLAKSVTVN